MATATKTESLFLGITSGVGALLTNWDLAREGKPLNQIAPLE